MDNSNHSTRFGQMLESPAHHNRCMAYLQPLEETYNSTVLTLEEPLITGASLVVAASCLTLSMMVLVLQLLVTCIRQHQSPPGSFMAALLIPVAAIGTMSSILCTQYPMGAVGRRTYTLATFVWSWCRHIFFFFITSANVFHLHSLHQPIEMDPTPPTAILNWLSIILTVFMLLILGAGLSTPSATRGLDTPPCGWAAIVQSYSNFDTSAEVWVIWLVSVAGVLSILSALAVAKKAIRAHSEISSDAAEHKSMLRWLLIESLCSAVLSAGLGLPATLLALYAPLNLTSGKSNFLWLKGLETILQTVYYTAIALSTFLSHFFTQDKGHQTCCIIGWTERCNCCQSSQVEPEAEEAVAATTHHVTTLVAEYIGMGSVDTEDEGEDSVKRKDTCFTFGGDSDSLFSVNVNMPQFTVKENLRRKTFFDRPSIISRAPNPTPLHGRPSDLSVTNNSQKSLASGNDHTRPLPSRHDSVLSQLSMYDLTNISLYSQTSITNQDPKRKKSNSLPRKVKARTNLK